jgi:hypothetical protein
MRRLVVAVVVALLAGGCGVATGGGPHPIPKSQVPFHLLSPEAPSTTTTTSPSEFTVPVTVYFVSSSQQYLVPAERSVAAKATLTTVLNVLLTGPTTLEADKGIKTAFSSDIRLLGVRLTTTVATVDFNRAFGQISGTQQVLAVAQVVYTVTGELGQDIGVQFEIAGQPTEVPTATGAQVPGPVHLLQYLALATPATTTTAPTTTTTTAATATATTAPG